MHWHPNLRSVWTRKKEGNRMKKPDSDQGHSIREIAAMLKLSHGTVQRALESR
jgi:transposase